MRILSLASELFPLVKTGGLADVSGALPLALEGLGCEVRSLVPGYPGLTGRLAGAAEVRGATNGPFGLNLWIPDPPPARHALRCERHG